MRFVPKGMQAAVGRLRGMRPVMFAPLAVAGAYWAGNEALLMTTSLILPGWLAWQELARGIPPGERHGPAPGERDAATGLGTRPFALRRLASFLAERARTGRGVGVIHIDLDGFRALALRHRAEVADMLIVQVAERLAAHAREDDALVRLDGDAFAVLLAPTRALDMAAAERIATRLQDAIARPFSVDRMGIDLTASVGICLAGKAPEPGAGALLQAAELACEAAWRSGPGGLRHFSTRMREAALVRHETAAEIAEALEAGQIRPWFQPQVSTDTGAVTGFEALARWEHPERGTLGPAHFLDAVARSGLSERLSEVMMFHALSAIVAWDRAGFSVGSVGVNFSTDELRNPRLVEKIRWEVDRFDLEPRRLTLEILETVICEDDDDTLARNIRALSEEGFGIDLDDFGTGHAAIANIRRFAVKRIKIDRGFIRGIDGNDEQRRLVSAIVRMAESLGVEVLAEGVETMAEQSILAQLGCDHIQGYGPARPMPFDDTLAWLARHEDQLARARRDVG